MWQNCALLEKIGIRMGYKDIKHLSVDNFNFTELWNASLYVHVYTFLWIKHIHTHTHTHKHPSKNTLKPSGNDDV